VKLNLLIKTSRSHRETGFFKIGGYKISPKEEKMKKEKKETKKRNKKKKKNSDPYPPKGEYGPGRDAGW